MIQIQNFFPLLWWRREVIYCNWIETAMYFSFLLTGRLRQVQEIKAHIKTAPLLLPSWKENYTRVSEPTLQFLWQEKGLERFCFPGLTKWHPWSSFAIWSLKKNNFNEHEWLRGEALNHTLRLTLLTWPTIVSILLWIINNFQREYDLSFKGINKKKCLFFTLSASFIS